MAHPFSPQDLSEAQTLLESLFTEVTTQEGTLSGGVKLGTGGQALADLRETKITFGNPKNELIRLTPKLFADLGLELSEIYKRQMRDQFDFYYFTLTVSLQPRGGAQFTRLTCSLDFGPKGPGEPIVQVMAARAAGSASSSTSAASSRAQRDFIRPSCR